MKIAILFALFLLSIPSYSQGKGDFKFSLGADFSYQEFVVVPLYYALDSDEDDEENYDEDDDGIMPWEWGWFKHGGIGFSGGFEYFLKDSLSLFASASYYPNYARGVDRKLGFLKSYSLDLRMNQGGGYFSIGISHTRFLSKGIEGGNHFRTGLNIGIGSWQIKNSRFGWELKYQTAQHVAGMKVTYSF